MSARPLPFTWPYALAFWVVFVWAFVPEFGFMRRAGKTATPSVDSGSLRLILAGSQLAMFIAFAIASFVPQFAAYRVPLFWIGLASMAAGSALRRHCFRVLGSYFTYAVQVAPEQQVVDRGAYRWVRHPSYTGGFLMFVGIGLALGNWTSVIILAVTTAAVYAYRVVIEERALLGKIGEPYRAYMRGRKRFIPFIF